MRAVKAVLAMVLAVLCGCDGGYIVCGETVSYAVSGGSDLLLIKTDTQGNAPDSPTALTSNIS